jgi:hypothetical protein
MNTIPEELLDRIVSYCKPPSARKPPHLGSGLTALHALCLTSRKVSRIAKTHLESMTFIHSNSGTQGQSFLRALKASPRFAQRITSFSIAHSHKDEQCAARIKVPDSADKSNRDPFDSCERLLIDTLPRFPNLQRLDLLGFVLPRPNSSSRRLWIDLLLLHIERDEDWYPAPFSRLRSLSVNLHTMGVEEIWPIFTLKELKEVELGLETQIDAWRDRSQSAYWPRGSSGVEHVVLRGLHSDRVLRGDMQLEYISRACASIKSMEISSQSLELSGIAVENFWQHFGNGTLQTVQLIAYSWVREYKFEKVENVVVEKAQIQKEVSSLLGGGGFLWEKKARLMESEHFRLVNMRVWRQEREP